MRVLHVVRQYAPSTGGLETYVDRLTNAQRERGLDVSILTLDHLFGARPRLAAQEGAIRRVPFAGWRRLFAPLLRPREFKGYDVVHLHAADQLTDLAALYCRAKRIPYVFTTHGLFFHTQWMRRAKDAYFRTITRFTLGAASAVFAVSGNDAAMVHKLSLDPILLHNPIVPIDAQGEGRDMVYIGRIAANKRIDRLLRFFAACRARDPAMRLHVIGADFEGSWTSLSRGLEDGVTYHGYADDAGVRHVVRTCGFIVSASEYEGFGLSIVEGMSAGLAPVLQDNAAFREICARSGVGLLLDFDDPELAATQFFNRFVDKPSESDRKRAMDFALTHSWRDVERRIYETYSESLRASRKLRSGS